MCIIWSTNCVVVYFQVYVIEVTIGPNKWTVRHRYSEFFELHEKVTDVTKKNTEAKNCPLSLTVVLCT